MIKNQNKSNLITFILILSIVVSGCGGGGGGGGSNGRSSRPNTGFRILHAGIDSAPSDVFITGGDGSSVAHARFGEASGYVSMKSGDSIISLSRANTPADVIGATPLSLGESEVKSILLYGDRKKIGEKLSIIDEPVVDVPADKAAVRVIHAAVGAAQISATAGTENIADAVGFGKASEYAFVTPGPLVLHARRVSDGGTIYSGTLSLEAGSSYTVMIAGEIGFIVLGQIL